MYVYHKFGLEGSTIVITIPITQDMEAKFISDGVEWDWMINGIYQGLYAKSLQECYNNILSYFADWSEDTYGSIIIAKLETARLELEKHESW